MSNTACPEYLLGRSFGGLDFSPSPAHKQYSPSFNRRSAEKRITSLPIQRRPLPRTTEIGGGDFTRLGRLVETGATTSRQERIPYTAREHIIFIPRSDIIERIAESANGEGIVDRLMTRLGGMMLSHQEAQRLATAATIGALDRYARYLANSGISGEYRIVDEDLLVGAIGIRLGHMRDDLRPINARLLLDQVKSSTKKSKLRLKNAVAFCDDEQLVFIFD